MKAYKILGSVILLMFLAAIPAWTIPSDLTGGDGIITTEDILEFLRTWHTSEGDPGYNPLADTNGDNVIDAKDFVEFAKYYENPDLEEPTPTSTYEPTSTPTETEFITPTFTATFIPTFTPTETEFITPTSTPTLEPTETHCSTHIHPYRVGSN